MQGLLGVAVENQDWVEGVITGDYREYYRKVYGQ